MKKKPLQLYDQAEVDRAAGKRVLLALEEERRRLRAWVLAELGCTFDGAKVLDWLEHDNWPAGGRR